MYIKDKIFEEFQKLGKAILLPIAILPVAGLFLGISSALSTGPVVQAYSLLNSHFLQDVFKVMNAVGKGVFTALPLIFAIGIAVGLSKKEKGAAALASLVGYFTLIVTINALLDINDQLAGPGVSPKSVGQVNQFGILTLQMGVFGGVITGIFTSIIHNKFYRLKLPDILAFFGGTRSVPIINAFVGVLAGVIMFLIWPSVSHCIVYFGSFVSKLGVWGGFLYGLLLRTFYVFGLHHVFYLPFWTTAAGGTLEVGGKVVQGWQNIFFAQLADSHTTHFFKNIAYFNGGRFIHMMFTMPAACFAMYKAIPNAKQRKQTLGFLISIALTSCITGITEPISYALLFASPLLFVTEALLFALSFLVAGILNIAIGSAFASGLIEYVLFGVFQGEAKTGYLYVLVAGIPFAIVSYFIFYTLIVKLNYTTPGREEEIDEKSIEKQSNTQIQENDLPIIILEGLGGASNITELGNCSTRLRVTIKKIALVNQDLLKTTGARHIIVRGKSLQLIYGTHVNEIRVDIDEYLEQNQLELG